MYLRNDRLFQQPRDAHAPLGADAIAWAAVWRRQTFGPYMGETPMTRNYYSTAAYLVLAGASGPATRLTRKGLQPLFTTKLAYIVGVALSIIASNFSPFGSVPYSSP